MSKKDDELKNINEENDEDIDLDIDDDFDMDFGDGDGDKPAGKRSPITEFSSGAKSALKVNSTDIKNVGKSIEKNLPSVGDVVSGTLSTAGEITDNVRNFKESLAPDIRKFKIAGRKALPLAKKFIPNKIYDRLKGALETEEKYQVQSLEDQRNAVIQEQLGNMFKTQIDLSQEKDISDTTDRLIDQRVDDKRFTTNVTILSKMKNILKSQYAFFQTGVKAYIIKSLELKYKSLFISQDQLVINQKMLTIVEDKLKTISHNTALPDIQKQTRSEGFKEAMREKTFGKMATTAGDFSSTFFKKMNENIKKNVFDKMLEASKEVVGMGTELTEGYVEMEGMKEEFGGGESGASSAGSKGIGLLKSLGIKFGGKTLAKMGGQKTKDFDDLVNTMKKNSPLIISNKLKELKEREGILGKAAEFAVENIFPTLAEERGIVSNIVAENPTDTVPWDVVSRKTLVEIIPGYLAKITKNTETIALGEEAEELVYDFNSESFVSVKELQDKTTKKFFGTKKTRAVEIAKLVGTIVTGYNKHGGDPDLLAMAMPDVVKFCTNSTKHGKDLLPKEIHKYRNGKSHNEKYISWVFKDIADPMAIADILIRAFFKDDKVNRDITTAFSQESFQITTNRDEFLKQIGKLNVFGQKRHFSDLIGNEKTLEQIQKFENDLKTKYKKKYKKKYDTPEIQEKLKAEISTFAQSTGLNHSLIRNILNDIDYDQLYKNVDDIESQLKSTIDVKEKQREDDKKPKAKKGTDEDIAKTPLKDVPHISGPGIYAQKSKTEVHIPLDSPETFFNEFGNILESMNYRNILLEIQDILMKNSLTNSSMLSMASVQSLMDTVKLPKENRSKIIDATKSLIKKPIDITKFGAEKIFGTISKTSSFVLDKIKKKKDEYTGDDSEINDVINMLRAKGITGKEEVNKALNKLGISKDKVKDIKKALSKFNLSKYGKEDMAKILDRIKKNKYTGADGEINDVISMLRAKGITGKKDIDKALNKLKISKDRRKDIKKALSKFNLSKYSKEDMDKLLDKLKDKDGKVKGLLSKGVEGAKFGGSKLLDVLGISGGALRTGIEKTSSLALKGITSGIKKVTGLVKIVDVYVKGDVKPGYPKVTAKQIRNKRLIRSDGKEVSKMSHLTVPILSKRTKETLISEDDIKKGLVDVDGKPIIKKVSLVLKGIKNTLKLAKNAVGGTLSAGLSGVTKIFGGIKDLFGKKADGKNGFFGKFKNIFKSSNSIIVERLNDIIKLVSKIATKGTTREGSYEDYLEDQEKTDKPTKQEIKKIDKKKPKKKKDGLIKSAAKKLLTRYGGVAAGAASGAAVAGASTIAGGVAATAGAASSAAMTTGAFLLTNPVGWAILGTAAVGATGYGLYKIFKDSDQEKVARKARMEVYGATNQQTKIIDKLEKKTLKNFKKGKKFDKGDIEDWADDFGLDEDETDQVEYWLTWYKKRFVPALMLYDNLLRQASKKGIDDIEDVDMKLVARVNSSFKKMASYKLSPYKKFVPSALGFKMFQVKKMRADYKSKQAKNKIPPKKIPKKIPPKKIPLIPPPLVKQTPGIEASKAAHSRSQDMTADTIALKSAVMAATIIPDDSELGSVSAKYESGRKGSMSIGFDRVGGTSYGTYQIAVRPGTFQKFLEWCNRNGGKDIADRLRKQGDPDGGPTGPVAREWIKLAGEGKIQALEKGFIKETHYQAALNKLPSEIKSKINSSSALQQALWSTSVQHGSSGAASIFKKSFSKNDSTSSYIKKIYNDRKTKFRSSTPSVRASVIKRFEDEKSITLAMINKTNEEEEESDGLSRPSYTQPPSLTMASAPMSSPTVSKASMVTEDTGAAMQNARNAVPASMPANTVSKSSDPKVLFSDLLNINRSQLNVLQDIKSGILLLGEAASKSNSLSPKEIANFADQMNKKIDTITSGNNEPKEYYMNTDNVIDITKKQYSRV